MRLKPGERNDRVLSVVDDRGATSQQVADRLGMAWITVRQSLCDMAAAGKVHRAKLTRKAVWYFRTAEGAQAFLASRTETAPPVVMPVKTRSGFAPGAKVVKPAGVKVQQCPGYRDVRFAVDGKVDGGFADLGIGRYVAETA